MSRLNAGLKDDGQKIIEQEMIETGSTGRGSAKVFKSPPAGWAVTGSALNALAAATKAGEVGKVHYISTVIASYSGAATGLLQVKDGTNVIMAHYVVNSSVISLPEPIKTTAGNAASAELADGGAGITGKVNLVGFTI
jgi:hypothetical protein